jgi:hypothetical protein
MAVELKEYCDLCKEPIDKDDSRIGMYNGIKWLACHGRCEDELEMIIKSQVKNPAG